MSYAASGSASPAQVKPKDATQGRPRQGQLGTAAGHRQSDWVAVLGVARNQKALRVSSMASMLLRRGRGQCVRCGRLFELLGLRVGQVATVWLLLQACRLKKHRVHIIHRIHANKLRSHCSTQRPQRVHAWS